MQAVTCSMSMILAMNVPGQALLNHAGRRMVMTTEVKGGTNDSMGTRAPDARLRHIDTIGQHMLEMGGAGGPSRCMATGFVVSLSFTRKMG